VPEINKSAYYNYAPQINQQQHQHQHNHSQNGYASQFQQLPNAKWASSYQINTQAAVMPATTTYLERDNNSSGESYYSQTSTVQKHKVISATPTPKKMVANGFPEGSGKTQRIYKTHSDLNKEKSRVKKTILKGDQKSKWIYLKNGKLFEVISKYLHFFCTKKMKLMVTAALPKNQKRNWIFQKRLIPWQRKKPPSFQETS